MKNSELIKILKAKEKELEEEMRHSKCALEVYETEENNAHNYLLLAEKTFVRYPSAETEEVYWKRYKAWEEAQFSMYAAEKIYDSFCESLEAVKEAYRTLEQLEAYGLLK